MLTQIGRLTGVEKFLLFIDEKEFENRKSRPLLKYLGIRQLYFSRKMIPEFLLTTSQILIKAVKSKSRVHVFFKDESW